MTKSIFTSIYFVVILLSISGLQAQTPPPDNSIYYQGDIYTTKITPPQKWLMDLDNPRADGRSAACYPREQQYYNAKTIVYIWIFKGDSLNFRKNISFDSTRYLKKEKDLIFKKTDTLTVAGDRPVYILESDDPGGKSKIGAVAYIDAKTEFIVLELDVSDRVYYVDGFATFWGMLKKIDMNER